MKQFDAKLARRIWLRRAYEQPSRVDGRRVLVDRLWPRGVTKQALDIDDWTRALAPSDDLRHWFGHDPARWSEFRTRYRDELASSDEAERQLSALADRVGEGRVTLVYAAADTEHNNAVALREVLADRLTARARTP